MAFKGLLSKKVLFYTLLIFLFLLSLLAVGIAYWFQHPQNNQGATLSIEKGTSLSQIAKQLSSQQILDFPFLFKAFLYGTGEWRNLKAGEYAIPPHVSPAQLIELLKSGNVILHAVTLIEGETSYHFVHRLLKDKRFLGDCKVPPEGSLLPETYSFARGTERQKIINRIENAMQNAVEMLWVQRSKDFPLKSPEELLIIASIVEKETGRPKERPLIAAVFLNRLKESMPLQADPTVLYALTNGEDVLGRDLTRNDLMVKSPYNTYLQGGLPPTPIANPSFASLKAVLNPAPVSYLYFVADGQGGHFFATTLEEHQRNHANWRKIRAKEIKSISSHR